MWLVTLLLGFPLLGLLGILGWVRCCKKRDEKKESRPTASTQPVFFRCQLDDKRATLTLEYDDEGSPVMSLTKAGREVVTIHPLQLPLVHLNFSEFLFFYHDHLYYAFLMDNQEGLLHLGHIEEASNTSGPKRITTLDFHKGLLMAILPGEQEGTLRLPTNDFAWKRWLTHRGSREDCVLHAACLRPEWEQPGPLVGVVPSWVNKGVQWVEGGMAGLSGPWE